MSQRRPVRDALWAIFFFALSGMCAWVSVLRLSDRPCSLGAMACSVADLFDVSDLLHARYGVVLAGAAVLLFALGLSKIWGNRHGE
jgi:hypothetical protein